MIVGWDITKAHTHAQIATQLQREAEMVSSGELPGECSAELLLLHEDEQRGAQRTLTCEELDELARPGLAAIKASLSGDSSEATQRAADQALKLLAEGTRRQNRELKDINKRLKTGNVSVEEQRALFQKLLGK